MQKFVRLIYTGSILLLGACHGAKEKQVIITKPVEESHSTFPVTDFFLGQLNETETLPVTPLKITITANKRDSMWLKKEDIRKFAAPFLTPVIDSVFVKNFFVEKSFMDQTINAITFSYDAKARLPDSVKLNHWDIYIDPEKNTVQRVYLVKESTLNNENVTTQLTWKIGKWCSIRTIIQQPGKEAVVKEEVMKWDFDD